MHSRISYPLLLILLFCNTLLEAQTASRLVAKSRRSYDDKIYAPVDSTKYSYSMGRGVDPKNDNFWLFDTCIEYKYNSGTSTYSKNSQNIQTFDGSNNILTNTSLNWDSTTSTWMNVSRTIYTYDDNNNQLGSEDQIYVTSGSSWTGYTLGHKFINTYDSHHNILTEIQQNWDTISKSYQNAVRFKHIYNSIYKITNDFLQYPITTTGNWYDVSQDIYRYDANKNLITDSALDWNTTTNAWEVFAYNVTTYNGANLPATYINQVWNKVFGALTNNQLKIYNYDSHNNMDTTFIKQWNTITHSWANYFNYVFGYNSINEDTFLYEMEWNNNLNEWYSGGAVTFYNYNSFRQTLVMTVKELYRPPLKGDGQVFYYYELYKPVSSINEIDKAKGSIKISPSPANTKLDVRVNWDEAQFAIIGIYDTQGRLWNQWQTNSVTDYHINIPVSQIPAGNYFVKVKGEKGALTEKFIVVH